ncbi:nuclear transport factor 2 family protein [Mycobacterium intermedium]|uniref:nuclear transport factor 2 family protein n=1 Tax=Mycobacterium intermedium TaxID=28445 RepID=UPI00267F5520
MPLPVEDVLEIERLISRYNFAFDRRDAEGFASCFTADGGFFLGDEEQTRGHDGLAEYVAAMKVPGQLRHVITSVLAEGDGASATSQAYCTVFASSPGGGYQVIAQGVYRDELTKGADGWRFTRRRFDQDPC